MSPTTYHRASRLLHWVMAFMLFYLVFLGWALEEKDSLRPERYDMHKSLGIMVLFLSFVRLGLRFAYKAPPELPAPKWQGLAAKAVHWGFYILMIGLPMSGWAYVSTSSLGRPTVLFDLVTLPHLPLPKAMHEIFGEGHHVMAKMMIYGLIPLHIIAALKHHFIDKDDTISRMIPGLLPKVSDKRVLIGWIIPIAVFVVALVLATFTLKGKPIVEKPAEKPVFEQEMTLASQSESLSLTAKATSETSVLDEKKNIEPRTWRVISNLSRLGFEAQYAGSTIAGSFPKFDSDIRFDPENLADSKVDVLIDLSNISTNDNDRDETLKGVDFFNIAKFPTARFQASRFEKTAKDSYVAIGTLNIKGIKKPHRLNFILKIDKDKAKMTAKSTVDRLDFGIGTGEYGDTSTLSPQVAITMSLTAKAS